MIVDALVPVKAATAGKGRLAEVLTPAERGTLMRAMLHDVVGALRASRLLRTAAVTSPDAEMLTFAAHLGAQPLAEPPGVGGLNDALHAAVAVLAAEGATSVLIVQGDVPLIEPADVAALLRPPLLAPLVRAAPSEDGGTSALLLTLPAAIPLAFGLDSFAQHRTAAHAAGVAFEPCPRAALAWDVDRPEDLLRLLQRPTGGETVRALRRMDIARRLGVGHGAAS